MSRSKRNLLFLFLFCLVTTIGGVYLLGGIKPAQLKIFLGSLGIRAPIIYILLYILATLFLLPSTPLNLTGGALFGLLWGTLWTSLGAVLAAIISFTFTRTIGREYMSKRLAGRWENLNAELYQGGLFYMFALRLLPLIPYGLVNFAAGLTSIKFKDYLLGTILGTVPGILPFVMMGSGLNSVKDGNVVPFLSGLGLIGVLVGLATWYRRRRRSPIEQLSQKEAKRVK